MGAAHRFGGGEGRLREESLVVVLVRSFFGYNWVSFMMGAKDSY